ncbi:hypothetical protein PYV02_14665 [Leifsonia sp. H3M29-4]|uniref:hypothetical protein n=1 Tax=Salinibacterium metalliresistens TaxID=3031321 RepID=UPI0023DC3BCC|nr:hypothetical protein [Salinibacterium metalliresistens]MDF1480325.1 hypothetical protein [Salinibacterium metalliresistens]
MSSPADGDKREQRLRRRRELRPRYEETERAWRAANADRVRAYRRRWIENNAVRQREASRVWNRRAYAARMRDVARRRNAVDRARRWAEQNPEKVKAAKIRYRLASPEKVKESSRRYYEQHKG